MRLLSCVLVLLHRAPNRGACLFACLFDFNSSFRVGVCTERSCKKKKEIPRWTVVFSSFTPCASLKSTYSSVSVPSAASPPWSNWRSGIRQVPHDWGLKLHLVSVDTTCLTTSSSTAYSLSICRAGASDSLFVSISPFHLTSVHLYCFACHIQIIIMIILPTLLCLSFGPSSKRKNNTTSERFIHLSLSLYI